MKKAVAISALFILCTTASLANTITLRNKNWDNGVWVDARVGNGSFNSASPVGPKMLSKGETWTISGQANQELFYKREASPGERPIRYEGTPTRMDFHTKDGTTWDI
jgi:hypothetical protein